MSDTDGTPETDLALKAVLAEAERIQGMLGLADGLVQARRAIDLSGLEAQVGRLCAQSLELPAGSAGVARVRLLALLRQVDGLTYRLENA